MDNIYYHVSRLDDRVEDLDRRITEHDKSLQCVLLHLQKVGLIPDGQKETGQSIGVIESPV